MWQCNGVGGLGESVAKVRCAGAGAGAKSIWWGERLATPSSLSLSGLHSGIIIRIRSGSENAQVWYISKPSFPVKIHTVPLGCCGVRIPEGLPNTLPVSSARQLFVYFSVSKHQRPSYGYKWLRKEAMLDNNPRMSQQWRSQSNNVIENNTRVSQQWRSQTVNNGGRGKQEKNDSDAFMRLVSSAFWARLHYLCLRH